MNIDVKNALDRVLNACEKIESMSSKDERFQLITEYVVEDVFDFINAISLTGAEERFQYFDVVYLNGAFSDHAFGDDSGGIVAPGSCAVREFHKVTSSNFLN